MFIGEEPEFVSEEEHRTSYLSMFMRIDRRFMGKCFGQMQELGIYPGQIPVLGLLAGFLFRKADEKDQRVSRIYLTEKGKQAKERGMKRVEENEKILLDGFSDAELCLLRRFLEQITENIDKIPGPSGKNDTKKARQQK